MLALLGIWVGTASVVAMLSGGKLAENEALQQFKSLGTELLAVTLRHTDNDRPVTEGPLTPDEISPLTKQSRDILTAAPYVQVFQPIQFTGHEINGDILGVSEALSSVAHIELSQGRFISDLDGLNQYCVIGRNIFDQIMKHSLRSPIKQQIQIGDRLFTIIGIAKPWAQNTFVYANINDSILIPAHAISILNPNTAVSNILMQLSSTADIEIVEKVTSRFLRRQFPRDELIFQTPRELIERMRRQTEIFTLFLSLIGGISLIVGGIGVMNIMLVSVIERRREIGIRRAVGATRQDIRRLFLAEALMISLLGGTLGCITGVFISFVISVLWHWSFAFFWLPSLTGFAVSAVTGIFSGLYPAHMASCLDPVEALRLA